MQHQDLCDNLPQTHDVRAMHHVHVTDVVPRKLDGTLFPIKMGENAPQKRVVASDNLHSGSDWPVSSLIKLSLKPHILRRFGVKAQRRCVSEHQRA